MNYYRRKHASKKGAVSHADDWLMTYADMITLLLCFFIIFLSVTVPKKMAEAQLTKPRPPVTNPRPMDILEGNLPFHGMETVTAKTDEMPEDVPLAKDIPEPEQALPPAPQVLPEAESLKAQSAKVEQKGDRITTLEMDSATFFDVGSATLSIAGKSILENITQTLKSDKYKDYQVTVEGHTDDSPIRTLQFPSNWELSTARASAVVHYFLEQGISPQKLRAAGYADTFPKVPNRDANGNAIPQNQAANRRVVIKLEKIDKQS